MPVVHIHTFRWPTIGATCAECGDASITEDLTSDRLNALLALENNIALLVEKWRQEAYDGERQETMASKVGHAYAAELEQLIR